MKGGGSGEPGPPFACRGSPGGWSARLNDWLGTCAAVARAVCFSAPQEQLQAMWKCCRREWNFGETEAYHWGTSRAGRDGRQVDSGLVALDGWFKSEYD